MRDARAVMHVGIANPRWRGKRSRYSRRMRNPQFLRIWQEAHGLQFTNVYYSVDAINYMNMNGGCESIISLIFILLNATLVAVGIDDN